MRIFFASDKTPNATYLPKSTIWHDNLYNGLVSLGCKVIEFKYDLAQTAIRQNLKNKDDIVFIKHNRPKITTALLSQIDEVHRSERIDVFLSYFSCAYIDKKTIEEIKRLGIVTINWFCNASYQMYLVAEIAPYYDFCLVPEKFRLDDYRRINANPIYMQEAADPHRYRHYNISYAYDVSFIGQAYGERPALVQFLVDNGVDIHVWGPRWYLYDDKKQSRRNFYNINHISMFSMLKNKLRSYLINPIGIIPNKKILNSTTNISMHRQIPILPSRIVGNIVSDSTMIQIFNKSKINIGFSGCATDDNEQRILQIRLRDFEIPMSGGFYLVEYFSELEEFYDIDKEIVCYRNKHDMLEKIKYYLTHDKEREKIRIAGYNRARRDHTWKRRFETAFKTMGIF